MSLRDLLIINLTLQVFDGLFSYQVLSLGATEANPFVSAAIANWGGDLRIALQEDFGLCAAVLGICVQAQPAIAY